MATKTATVGTLLFTWAKGRLVGVDSQGNRYYTERRTPKNRRAKRWMVFNGAVEASRVPAEWHAWLHYTVDQPLPMTKTHPHRANLTGTSGAYLPPGHDLMGGVRERAAGDYEAWTP